MPGQIKLTISINAGSAVEIDSAGKKGGNMRGKALRRVRWTKDASVDRFDLKFERLEDADGALSLEADWPFIEARVAGAGGAFNEDTGTVTGVERFSARLADAGVYKYTVTAYKNATVCVLDPAIIVDK
jgi:hypothetical protein